MIASNETTGSTTMSGTNKRTEQYHNELLQEHKEFLCNRVIAITGKFMESGQKTHDDNDRLTPEHTQLALYSCIHWKGLTRAGIKPLHEIITGRKWTLNELKNNRKMLLGKAKEIAPQIQCDSYSPDNERSLAYNNDTWERCFALIHQFFVQTNSDGIRIFGNCSVGVEDKEYDDIYQKWVKLDGVTMHKAVTILAKCSWTEEQRQEMSKLLGMKLTQEQEAK